jgi:PII-like signaling protein
VTSTVLLRIFLNEDDRFGKRALVDAIVDEARLGGIAGATVLKAIEGFAGKGALHSARVVDALGGLPIAIEIVDEESRVAPLVARVRGMMTGGLITVEGVAVVSRPGR